jgi:hypothetical protein
MLSFQHTKNGIVQHVIFKKRKKQKKKMRESKNDERKQFQTFCMSEFGQDNSAADSLFS